MAPNKNHTAGFIFENFFKRNRAKITIAIIIGTINGVYSPASEILNKESLPITMTSYSPCFRKEVGAHGIEERGIYRVHQFEKQEMIVICEPEESMDWYEKMWRYTVEIFRNMDIPVRQLECCSGDGSRKGNR